MKIDCLDLDFFREHIKPDAISRGMMSSLDMRSTELKMVLQAIREKDHAGLSLINCHDMQISECMFYGVGDAGIIARR